MAEAKKTAKSTEPKADKKAKVAKKAEIVAETAPLDTAPEEKKEVIEEKTTKAGKRSAKAQREVAEKEVKTSRKESAPESSDTKKQIKKPSRPKAERAGRKYREAIKNVDKNKAYSLTEAVDLALKMASTKFDSTVELHVNLGVDPKQADQNVRDSLVLPAGTGKASRVAVLAEDDLAKAAAAAGADVTDGESLLAQLDKEQIEFDVLIATPTNMPKLGKYARLLGPRGLMPNPKSGTVTTDVAKAIKEAKAGKVEYRVDQAGIVHMGIGKVSFGSQKINQNADAAIGSIKSSKPASLKGIYIKSAYLTTTMGPSVKVDIS